MMKNRGFKGLGTVLFCLVFLWGAAVQAGEDSLWEELSVYGGQIYTIAVDPDNWKRLYAGSWNGDGFFISDDAGWNWKSVTWFRNSAVYDIEIDPNDSDTIWVANDHEIEWSTNGGQTWQSYTLPDGRFCYSVAVDPNDWTGQTVFIGTSPVTNEITGGTVFETYDGGETWEPHTDLPTGFTTHSIMDLDFDPNSRDVWATSNTFGTSNISGIYVFTNEGGSWQWYGWEQKFYMDELMFHPSYADTLFACGDGGVWKKTDGLALGSWENSFSNSDYFARAMCIPPTEPNYLFSAMLEDGTPIVAKGEYPWEGDYWYYTSDDDAPDEFICLAADNEVPFYLYAGGINEGFFRSTDSGDTWESFSYGMLANTIYDSDVSPEDPSELTLATLGGIYRNTGSGALSDDISYAVTYHPSKGNTLYAGQSWGLSKSTDSGATWNFFNPLDGLSVYDGESYRVLSVAVAETEGTDTVYAGVSMDVNRDGYILRILDTGGSFSSSYFYYGHSDTPINCIAVHPEDPEKVFIGMGSFYSPVKKGGLNVRNGSGWLWISLGTADGGDNVVVNDIAIEQPPYANDYPVMFAACGGSDLYYAGIYKSIDDGATWVKKEDGLPDHYAVTDIKIDPDDSNIVYAALYKGYDDSCTYSVCPDRNGIYVSYDGGEYWSQLGLSDYYLYDVNVYNTGGGVSARAMASGRSLSYPTADVYGGSASGGHTTSMSTGRGTVMGFVKSSETGGFIGDADIMSLTSPSSKTRTMDNGYFNLNTATGTHRISIRAENHSSVTQSNVVVVNGGFADMGTITLSGGTPGPDPVPDGTCFLEDILGIRSSALQPFRDFRDNVLNRTKYGRGLAGLYYRSGTEILAAMAKNPGLRDRGVRLVEKAVPLFSAISCRERATVTVEFLNRVSAFLFELEKYVSPDLKEKIYQIRLSIKREDLFERLSVNKLDSEISVPQVVGPEKACRIK